MGCPELFASALNFGSGVGMLVECMDVLWGMAMLVGACLLAGMAMYITWPDSLPCKWVCMALFGTVHDTLPCATSVEHS